MLDSDGGDGSRGYLYYPGCSLKGTGVAYEESLLTLFRLLHLPLEELPDWNCCGATTYMSIDERFAALLAARNLAMARRMGRQEVVAPCNACYLVLRKCIDYMRRYSEIHDTVTGYLKRLDLPLPSSVSVRHPLEVLYHDVGVEQLRSKAVRRWSGGPVACYYGCLAVRPYSEVDTARNPARMDALLEAVGIPTVNYPHKTRCCGGSHTGTLHSVGVRLNYILLKEAMRKGAQALVTICPLCQFNLDAYQEEIRKETHEALDMPILYLTQLLGWVLGADPRDLGLQRGISGKSLLKQWFFAQKEVEEHV
jgi:heterodisulfide reductase subunit B